MSGERYAHGHHESVLRSHRWRTAENSCAYLLPHLRPGLDVLDVGCGPGTITVDLAGRVAPGRVVGVDRAGEVLPTGHDNVSFEAGDAYGLRFEDASFDVVHAHQMLHHLTDPVAALREMRRVLRPGGLLASRESDYGAFWWAPASPLLDRWLELFRALTRRHGSEADAGRHLPAWVRAAGFDRFEVGTSTWTFATDEDRHWWAESWADRVEQSDFARQTVECGLSTPDELAAIAGAFRAWAEEQDGLFVVVHGEVLGWKA